MKKKHKGITGSFVSCFSDTFDLHCALVSNIYSFLITNSYCAYRCARPLLGTSFHTCLDESWMYILERCFFLTRVIMIQEKLMKESYISLNEDYKELDNKV